MGSGEGLELDKDVIFNSDGLRDLFNFSLEVGDLGDEERSKFTGFRASLRDFSGESVELEFKGINLRLEFKILFSDGRGLFLDLGGDFFLSNRHLGEFGLERTDSQFEFTFSLGQGLENKLKEEE